MGWVFEKWSARSSLSGPHPAVYLPRWMRSLIHWARVSIALGRMWLTVLLAKPVAVVLSVKGSSGLWIAGVNKGVAAWNTGLAVPSERYCIPATMEDEIL